MYRCHSNKINSFRVQKENPLYYHAVAFCRSMCSCEQAMLDTELNQLVDCCVPSMRSYIAVVAVFRSTEPLRQSHAALSGARFAPPNNRRLASLFELTLPPERVPSKPKLRRPRSDCRGPRDTVCPNARPAFILQEPASIHLRPSIAKTRQPRVDSWGGSHDDFFSGVPSRRPHQSRTSNVV